MEQNNFSWALSRNNKLVHISHVERGLKCDCVCPHCKTSLIARKGSIKVHHFAHVSEDCKHGYESAVHLLAKSVFEKNKTLALPSYEVYLDSETDTEIISLLKKLNYNYFEYTPRPVDFDEVKTEAHLEDMTPDAIATKNNRQLLVEFCYTHPIDDSKFEKIKKQGISCVEINISEFQLSESLVKDETNMQLFLKKNAIEHSHWVFNPNIKNSIKRELKRLIPIEEEKIKKEIQEKEKRDKWRKNIINESEERKNILVEQYRRIVDIALKRLYQNDCRFTKALRKLTEPPYETITPIKKLLNDPFCWKGDIYGYTEETKHIYIKKTKYNLIDFIPRDKLFTFEHIIKKLYRTRHVILERNPCNNCQFAQKINIYGEAEKYFSNNEYINFVFCTKNDKIPESLITVSNNKQAMH